eukprot:gene11959-12125_t
MKKLLLTRHGKSEHNVVLDRYGAGELDRQEFLKAYVAVGPDPTLTAKGREMAIANGRANKEAIAAVDFFVVSPMSRTLETFLLVLKGAGIDPDALLPNKVFLQPLVTEEVGSPKHTIATKFPVIKQWGGFQTMDDLWWPGGDVSDDWPLQSRELNHPNNTPRSVNLRVNKFKQWLHGRPEQTIMVVSHGYFLLNLTERSEIDTALRGITNHAAAKEAWDGYLAAAETTHFLECEMRTYRFGTAEDELALIRTSTGINAPDAEGSRANDTARAILKGKQFTSTGKKMGKL